MSESINRVGEKSQAKNGMEMTIIAYHSYNDIDVQFEDGAVAYRRTYHNFKAGNVKHPTLKESGYTLRKAKEYIGQRIQSKNGMWMEIIAYHGSKNITVRFEDGTIVSKVLLNSFKSGNVKNPALEDVKLIRARESHLGERTIAKNGLGMEVIGWKNANDITIRFDDGVVVDHKIYSSFAKGYIQHPSISKNDSTAKTKLKQNAEKRVGEQVVNKQGEVLTLVAYRNASSVDVQFSDGTIVMKRYNSFKNGNVTKRTLPKDQIDKTGETKYSKSGILMKVIKYHSAKSMMVEFEDGSVVNKVSYGQFSSGYVQHPKFRKNSLSNEWEVGDYIITGLAYIAPDGHGEFYCENKVTGDTDIFSMKEILS